MKEVNHHFANIPVLNLHDCIFQTLDRVIDYDEDGKPICYPADVYEAGIHTADESQIIFALDHPDAYLYEEDPEKAIREVGGKVAGALLNPYVNRIGHATARGQMGLIPDPDIEALIAEGKLSMSPSVWTTYDDEGRIIKIRFQNLLIFPEVPGGATVPRDPGTIILNTKKREETTSQTQFSGKIMTETIEKPVVDPAVMAQLQELSQQFSTFKKDLDTAKSEADGLKAQLASKDEELAKERETFAQFTAKIEAEKEKTKIAEFQSLIHDPLFPEGLLKTENAEEQLKAEFDASPAQFAKKILTVYAMQNKFLAGAGEQGQQFTKEKSEDPVSEMYSKGKTMFEKFGLTPEDIKKVV